MKTHMQNPFATDGSGAVRPISGSVESRIDVRRDPATYYAKNNGIARNNPGSVQVPPSSINLSESADPVDPPAEMNSQQATLDLACWTMQSLN